MKKSVIWDIRPLLAIGFLLYFLFHTEVEGDMFLRNVG
jgi:hypothetical protein